MRSLTIRLRGVRIKKFWMEMGTAGHRELSHDIHDGPNPASSSKDSLVLMSPGRSEVEGIHGKARTAAWED